MFDRLIAYLDSVRARDPAPRSRAEILIYPGVWALGLSPKISVCSVSVCSNQ